MRAARAVATRRDATHYSTARRCQTGRGQPDPRDPRRVRGAPGARSRRGHRPGGRARNRLARAGRGWHPSLGRGDLPRREGITNRRAAALVLALALAAPGARPSAASSLPATTDTGAAAPAITTGPFASTLEEAAAPGVVHRHGWWTTDDGPQAVDLIDVAPGIAGITLEASAPAAGVSRLQTVPGQAGAVSRDGHRVVAAVNGDTWTTSAASGLSAPTGLLVHGGELLSGSRSARPTFGLNASGSAMFGDVAVTTAVTLPGGATLTVDRINKLRVAGDLDLYTPSWGASTGTGGDGSEVVLAVPGLPLRAGGSWAGTVTAVRTGAGGAPLAAGTLVLSAQGDDAAALDALPVGALVTITTTVPVGWAGVAEAVSGREWLVRAGLAGVSPVSSVTWATHPRTAVGARPDGTLVLVTVDGRQPGESSGVTDDDLADLLVAQGVQTAVNLDGGGSTTALARHPGDITATLVNSPSGGSARAVADALLVVSSIPTGPLAQLVVRTGDTTVMAGENAAFTARGTDSSLNAVPVPASAVTWSVAGSGATISPAGVVATTAPGSAIVTATSGSASGRATLTVLADTVAPTPVVPTATLTNAVVASNGDVAVAVRWTAATDIGEGVARYELQRRIGGGAWTAVALPAPLSRSIAQRLGPQGSVEYQVRAVDRAGNASPWQSTGAFGLQAASERSAKYTGRWLWQTGSLFLARADRASKTAGSTASLTFTGSQFAWIAPKGPTRGSARIYVDGVSVAAVSLYATSTQSRRVVYTRTWPSSGRHQVTIRVSGTARHPWVDVDGFAVITAAG